MNLETEIHRDLWAAIRRSYEAQAWSTAILDAVHLMSETIRARSGLQSDGVALAGQAFGGKDPKLKVNRLQTESDTNVQQGIEQMVRGVYQAIRNPRSHEKIEDTQPTADAVIIFINFLLAQIGLARASFSIEAIVSRIHDENFVPNDRYAALMIAEIPKAKRLDTAIAMFNGRDLVDSNRHRTLFKQLAEALDDSERGHLFEAISAHLAESQMDNELRSVMQILSPIHWSLVGEAERMRSENRLIRNMKTGRYIVSQNKCTRGGLGTFARNYLRHFTLRGEALRAVHLLLTSESREAEDYAIEFLLDGLEDLADKPPVMLRIHLNARLKAGDMRYYTGILGAFWTKPEWEIPFKDAIDKFVEVEQTFPEEPDDLPF